MKKCFALVTLMLFTLSCHAQSDLVFNDADGNRVGVLVQVDVDGELTLRSGVNLARVDKSGKIDRVEAVYYTLPGCAGQAYVDSSVHEGKRGFIVTQLVLDSDSNQQRAWAIEWVYANPTVVSRLPELGGCRDLDAPEEIVAFPASTDPIPANMIPAIYVGTVTNVFWGLAFKVPLQPVLEQSNAISCNGFESCPQ